MFIAHVHFSPLITNSYSMHYSPSLNLTDYRTLSCLNTDILRPLGLYPFDFEGNICTTASSKHPEQPIL